MILSYFNKKEREVITTSRSFLLIVLFVILRSKSFLLVFQQRSSLLFC